MENKPPEKIYLQYYGDDEEYLEVSEEITWCEDKINNSDLIYVLEPDNKSNFFLDKETLERMLRLAFDMGESWGTTYQGWFDPPEDMKKLRVQEAIYLCYGEI